MRMPTNPPQVDLKVEMLPELCKEEGVSQEPTFPIIESWLHIEVGRYVCWNKSNTMLVSLIQNEQASLERN